VSVDQPDVIDFLTHDSKTGEVILVMVEGREWDGSDVQLRQLQEKFNNYVSFALEGGLAQRHPELAGAPVILELRARHPDRRTQRFLDVSKKKLADLGLHLRWQDIRTNPMG
jgi:uncharacterized protein DUF6572